MSDYKVEVKTEDKVGDLPLDSKSIFAGVNDDDTAEMGALYICANCTTQLRLGQSSTLQCPHCEHITGSSTVFYKVRTQATTYDTI